jgi:hypothetical protein
MTGDDMAGLGEEEKVEARWIAGRGGGVTPFGASEVESWNGLSLDSVGAELGGTTGEEEGEKKEAKPLFQSMLAGRDRFGLATGVVVSGARLGGSGFARAEGDRRRLLEVEFGEGDEEKVVRKLVEIAETDLDDRWPGRTVCPPMGGAGMGGAGMGGRTSWDGC